MYDDFKMCDGVEFDKIAKEYYKKNKAQILDLSGDTKYNKEEFKDILNLSKNLYFDLKQRGIKGFEDVLKNVKLVNLELAKIYKDIFLEDFVPDINKSYNFCIVKGFVELIKRLIGLLKRDNLGDFKENIMKYLDILGNILEKNIF